MSNSTESNFSFTTKVDGDLLTVRGDDIQSFQANLDAAAQSGIGANIKNFVTSVNNTSALNAQLGAMPVDPAQNPAPVQAPPASTDPTPGDPWGQGGQQPQGQWSQQPQQGGNNNWGQPPQQAQTGWGQPQGGGDWRADPHLQPPHLQPPMTPFGPARYKGGFAKSTGKPYRIWSDPRPWNEIKNLPKDQQFSQFIKDSEL
ncbi:hypothetical protein GCM10009700_35020 [Brevibacterium sanguinis]|uniref:hypothetical protein n=1 Tax=Brevibacterium sanguinis TaxID=232444 RepID=UPI0031CE303D